MYLTTTDQTIFITSDSTATTAEQSVVVDYVDITSTTFTPGVSLTATSGTSEVVIAPSPAASVTRQVKYINIFNTDTVDHIITVVYDNNGTEVILTAQRLRTGKVLSWTPEHGWVNTGAESGGSQIEVGTWTPEIRSTSGGEVVTYSQQDGYYNCVDDFVSAIFTLAISGYTGGGGNTTLGGLPFNPSDYSGSCSIGYANGAGARPTGGNINAGVDFITLRTFSTTFQSWAWSGVANNQQLYGFALYHR